MEVLSGASDKDGKPQTPGLALESETTGSQPLSLSLSRSMHKASPKRLVVAKDVYSQSAAIAALAAAGEWRSSWVWESLQGEGVPGLGAREL